MNDARMTCIAAWVLAAGIGGEPLLAQVEVAPFRRRVWAGRDMNWGGNRLLNSSFEEGFAGWSTTLGARQVGDVVRSRVETSDTIAHTGGQSLHLMGDSDTTLWYAVESDPVAVTPEATYKFAGWMKSDLVECEGEQYRNSNLYIKFLDDSGETVLVGESPVRATRKVFGSHDWMEVSRIIKAPKGSSRAIIGCALTCTGWVWFDDIGLYEGERIEWQRHVGDRIIYFYEHGTGPSDDVAKKTESYLIALEQFLGLQYPGKIWYYRYDSRERKELISGARGYSHLEGDDIHSVLWDDRHDIVHVVMKVLGVSTPLLAEGLAVYAAEAVPGRAAKIHDEARKLAKATAPIPISRSLSAEAFNRHPRKIAHAQAGSFVGFLIERYGIDKFKIIYPLKKRDVVESVLPKRIREIYGVELGELEKAWRKFLLTDSSPG